MKENKNKILIAIIILLLLSNICFITFIAYDKRNNKDDDKQQDEAKEEDKEKEESKTNLEVSETDAKKVYYDILSDETKDENGITYDTLGTDSSFSSRHIFYSDKKIIIKEDLDYDTLMQIAYYKIPDDKIEYSFTSSRINTKFLVSDIKEVYTNYFGENNEWKNFNGTLLGTCTIRSEYYNCVFDGVFGDELTGIHFLTAFDKYETDSENLYVYEKAVYYFEDTWGDEKSSFYTSCVDHNLEKEVVELKGKDPKVLLDEQYRDKFSTYKHTFKQNSDGTFYLYSTEPVTK